MRDCFFLCTNGIIGISLGICSYYIRKESAIWILSSIALTITLSVMNYGIGIPVFWHEDSWRNNNSNTNTVFSFSNL